MEEHIIFDSPSTTCDTGTGLFSLSTVRGLGSSVVRLLAAGVKGPAFNYQFTQHFEIFIYRAFTYNAVGSLVSSWSCVHTCGFIPARTFGFNCVITPGKGYVYTS